MKAITIKQPWASLIVNGFKDIENRTWKTNFRGRVLIHAGLDIKNKPILNRKQTDALYRYYTGVGTQRKNFGAIIGSVEIVDCVINHPSIWAEKNYLKLGDVVPYKNTRSNIKNAKIISFENTGNGSVWFNGVDTITNAKVWYPVHISLELMDIKPIYNWVLANPALFDTPIPAKGKLSFWESGIEVCHICGQPANQENLCERCNKYYCDDCTAHYDQFTQIDYNCCSKCFDGMRDNLYWLDK